MADFAASTDDTGLDPWLAAVGGRFSASDGPDLHLAAAAGWLIRARFHSALSEVRAEPEPPLTRARILARARRSRAIRRWGLMLCAVGIGLAAGVAVTLAILAIEQPSYLAVISSAEVRPAAGTQAFEIQGAGRTYAIRTRDVGRTAGQIVDQLATARMKFRVQTLGSGGVEVDVDAMATIPYALARMAGELHIRWDVNRTLRLLIEPA